MQSMTVEAVRWWCKQPAMHLKLTEEDMPYYESEEAPSFVLKTPPEHRRISALAHDILMLSDPALFEGGVVWLYQWEIGVAELVRPGWRIIEDIRRAHGDLRSLEIAPAELFRNDEFVELHAFLIQVMAYGWSGHFIPSVGGYFLQFTTSERLICKAKSAEKLQELYSALKIWTPSKQTSNGV